MAPKTLYLTRHAQAEHNVAEDYSIPDAPLTALGRQQSIKLNKDTVNTFQKDAELLVCSPLRRPMQTMLGGYPGLMRRLQLDGPPNKVIILPQLQEVNALPCDTGSSRSTLESNPEFMGLDFSLLTDDWTSKAGIYDPSNVQDRAKWVRRWLREREESSIVVVAHGDILRQITHTPPTDPWANAEVRVYTFKSEEDEEAEVVRKLSGEEEKEGGREPTSGDKVGTQ